MGFFRSSGIVNGKGFFGAVSQAQAFVPTDISGCMLWVSADYGVTTGSGSFLSQIVISGCDPSSSDGTYSRTDGGETAFDETNGNQIYYDGGIWFLYDNDLGDITFYNPTDIEDENAWEVFNATEFGTATNTTTNYNNVVTEILDRSSNTNNLTKDYGFPLKDTNIINGKPAFYFYGGRLAGNDVDTAKTIYAVIKTQDPIPSAYAVIIESTGGGLYSNVGPNWGSYFGGSFYVNSALNSNSSYVLGSISSNGTNYEFRQNGSSVKTGTDGQGFISRSSLYFGSDSSNTQTSKCYVAEAVVYDKAITTSEAGQLESYLNSKYAIY